MNNKPGMAEDFVLNGNCQTTQDPTLKEQLCPKALPQTGSSLPYVVVVGIILAVIYYIIRRKR